MLAQLGPYNIDLQWANSHKLSWSVLTTIVKTTIGFDHLHVRDGVNIFLSSIKKIVHLNKIHILFIHLFLSKQIFRLSYSILHFRNIDNYKLAYFEVIFFFHFLIVSVIY